ncbi:hypothetical protein CI238_08184 [Colletotrichum incanum]|uniref:Uncharacterized protein n=1 Tax=Colletotrichum incanum TaxID=1573173 RepID=A0A167DFD4_COLIC|nr:hypothetical protein CI238_08184 [Colletotrichum incanum]
MGIGTDQQSRTAVGCFEAYNTLKEVFPCLAATHHNSRHRFIWALLGNCIIFLDARDSVKIDSFTLLQIPNYPGQITHITHIAINPQSSFWGFASRAMGRVYTISSNVQKVLLVHDDNVVMDEVKAMIVIAMSRDGGSLPCPKLHIPEEFQKTILKSDECHSPEWPQRPELLVWTTAGTQLRSTSGSLPLPHLLQYIGLSATNTLRLLEAIYILTDDRSQVPNKEIQKVLSTECNEIDDSE